MAAGDMSDQRCTPVTLTFFESARVPDLRIESFSVGNSRVRKVRLVPKSLCLVVMSSIQSSVQPVGG